ncbi:MAG TPA: BatA domain-containing protein [Gemmatimonadaceae bacterium]|nr:BatA domain-containing protein [Gemmatimonadaceae bacterium]
MIDFLSPLWLLAAGAAAVPLLIHLLRRRTGTRVEFPAVRYLARAEREHSRKLRLRNLLLMLLRVAAVLLIAAAAARPVVRVRGSGHAPTALAIVLDNSLSTSAIVGGKPVFDDLRARARDVVGRASATDRLWLVTADGVVRGGTRGALLGAIDHAEPLAGAGDPAGAAARASALVSSAGLPEREIVILTDGQATAWPEPVAVGGARVRVYRPRGEPPVNRAVTRAGADPLRWTPRGAVRARVLTPDSATYRIVLEGRTLARGTASRDEEVLVRAAPPERGWTTGAVELEPDELRGDDTRWFAAWIGAAPAVHASAALGPFTSSAVDALVQAERATQGNDIAIAPADEGPSLPALLVAPSDPVRVGAANRQLERLGIPWRFGAVRRGESAVRATAAGEPAFEGVTATMRYVLQPRGAAPTDTLATVAGEPWVVAGPRWVLVASPLVPDATTLPVRAAFVPWLGDVLSQRLGEDAGVAIAAAPRASVSRPEGADALEMPGGERVPLPGDTLAAPEHPGVYFFLHGGARSGALVVNPEPGESDLRRLAPGALAARLRGSDVRALDDATRLRDGVLASAPRRPVILPLLALALAALVAEAMVAGTGARRPRVA